MADLLLYGNTQTNVNAQPITAGQLLYTTDLTHNKQYLDKDDTTRVEIGGMDLITSEVDFNAQTASTSHAVDSFILKEILDDMNGEALTGTLPAGATSITFTDAMIVTGNTIKTDYYTDVYGVSPTAVEVTTGSMTLTFDAQTVDVAVRVEIRDV